jgi:hypothetical protein
VEFENTKARGKPIVLLFGARCVAKKSAAAAAAAAVWH